jgi:serine/threonine protein kinase
VSFVAGQTIGDYEVLDVIGSGGMGEVYRVRNVISGRLDAVKVLLPDVEIEPEAAARFTNEIRVLAALDHANIAALRTALRVENQLIMVMEFVDGATLAERLQEGALPLPEALSYAYQTLSALGYAHNKGVVHRDIKPANMMITPEGRLKLMDFGIAKAAGHSSLTKSGATVGSPYYMSPEQVRRPSEDLDGRSDLYSLGLVLYEMATGRRPFAGDSDYAIMDAQVRTPPTPPIDLDPGIPAALNEAILTALQKDPGQRFQTAEEFRRTLKPLVLSDQTGTDREPAPHRVEANVRPTSRSWRPAYLVTAALAVLATFIVVAVLLNKRPKLPEVTLPAPAAAETPPLSLRTRSGEMVLVSAGDALLGKELHPVSVPSFYIDKTEVTNEVYLEFCHRIGHEIPPRAETDRSDYPVVYVTFDDARTFCAWAGKRLPTAQEWEKAARGTEGRVYPWGDTLDYERANIPRDEAAAMVASPAPAMSYEQGESPYGVRNMLGNVWEWVDTRPPALGDADFVKLKQNIQVTFNIIITRADVLCQVRGGSYRSWKYDSSSLLWDYASMPAGARSQDIGFRCAKDVKP